MKLMKRLSAHTPPTSLIKQLKNSLLIAVSMLIFVLLLFAITSTVIVTNQFSFNQRKADITADEAIILNSGLDQYTAIRTYIITNNPTSLAPFTSGRNTYLMNRQRLRQLMNSDGLTGDSVALTQVDAQYNEWYTRYALVVIKNMQSGNLTVAASDKLALSGRAYFLNFRGAQMHLVQESSQSLLVIQQKITGIDIAAFALAIGLTIIVIVLLQRTFKRFTVPFYNQLETFKEATHLLTAGERAARVPPLDYEELNDVAQSFNLMAHALQQQQEELQLQYNLAREANVSKSSFLASMSHELRTPLNAIIGFSELLYDEVVGTVSEEQKDYLGDVLASGRHLLDLINEVLDLSKVEAGKIVFHPEIVHVEEVLDLVLHTVHQMATDKEVLLLSELDPTLVDVRIDPVRFRQVLFNYLSNAIKFTPKGGQVRTRITAESKETFRLEVKDTGVGIKPEDCKKLFVEFQQVGSRSTSSGRYQGTGLGLALTKKLVEAQGGSVGMQSVFGQGSTFFAILPRSVKDGKDGQGKEGPKEEPAPPEIGALV